MLKPDILNILIVDDNKNNLLTLHSLIDRYIADVEVTEANSGMAALTILMKKEIDLIILDIQMPEMDGFETARTIRSWKKMQHVPIVFLTAAYKSEEFEQKGFAAGAADYLTKPIDTHQLVARIQTYLRFIRQEHQHKQELEQKVQERTKELVESNHQLEEAKKNAEQAKIEAESANLAKSQFLATMSHELRTPLNIIIGYAELLQETAQDIAFEELMSDLQKIEQSGQNLLFLINEILDLSKIEAGKSGLYIETVDLTTLVDDIICSVQPLMEKNNNALKIHYSNPLGKLCTDEGKLRQILFNLFSNAGKFTERGTIRFEVVREIKEKGDWVHFYVSDTGIGITEKQLSILFQPFTQVDASTTRRYGGAGLGLAISQQYTKILGGSIEVNSKLGEGSTFIVHLPVSSPSS